MVHVGVGDWNYRPGHRLGGIGRSPDLNVLITGASGYVARVTLPRLLEDEGVCRVIGLDIRPSAIRHPKYVFLERDVTRDELASAMEGIDVLVHMAFIVGEIRDKKQIYAVNVDGTRRVLEAAVTSGVQHLVVASSVSAYGSMPRGGEITEDTPRCGNDTSYYSHTKRLMEEMLDEFELRHPGVAVTRVRPSILCGAQTDNFFLDMLEQRVIVYPRSNRAGLPLVHEDDVGRAFYLAIKGKVRGAFNIASGNLSFRAIGAILGRRTVGLPYGLLKPVSDVGFWLGLLRLSSHWVSLGRYPFHVDCTRANTLLNWAPRYSPEAAFREMVAAWKQ
jgi:UDP-glucose 4-epimerase